jgi:methionine biosynthesis protein MetW
MSTGGIDKSREGVNECVAKGLADPGRRRHRPSNYPDDAFDYVILSQTAPRGSPARWNTVADRHAVAVPELRPLAGPAAALAGHMPRTDMLPFSWYDTPNIHHCTIKDFASSARQWEADESGAQCLGGRRCGSTRRGGSGTCSANKRVFLLSRRD